MAEKVENIGNAPGQSTNKSFGLSGLGSLISGGISALDSIFGWSSKRQERAQQRLMDKQQNQWKEQQQILADQMLAQWNRENEYNDPTNYYQRLFDAAEKHGINPNLLVQGGLSGSVGQSATGVSVPGSTSVPGVGGVTQQSIGGNMNTVLAGLRQRAEIDNIQAQTDSLRQGIEESGSRIDLNRTQADLNRESMQLVHNQALSESTRNDLLQLNKTMEFLKIGKFNQITDAQLAEAWARIGKIKVDTSNAEKEGKYIEETASALIDSYKSQITLNSALYVVNKALAKKYGTETFGISIDNLIKGKTKNSVVDKIIKESQYYDFNQLKSLFSNPTSLIFALSSGIGSAFDGNADSAGLYQLLVELYELAERNK